MLLKREGEAADNIVGGPERSTLSNNARGARARDPPCGVAGSLLCTYTRNGKILARADLILTLIKASRQGNDLQVRKAVEALAADERAKNHTILADRLLAQLQSGNTR